MVSPSYINIHTHLKPRIIGEYVIRNAFHKLSLETINTLPYDVSVGLHPWHLTQISKEALATYLHSVLKSPRVKAIGEIGIDKAIDAPLAVQIEYFELQYQMGIEYKKPLIIHSVRSYNEMAKYIRLNQLNFVMHGFNGNMQTAESLLAQNSFLSFGRTLFTPKGIEIFKQIPLDKIFLETDNHHPMHIADIYNKAAEIKCITIEALRDQLNKNANTLLGTNF